MARHDATLATSDGYECSALACASGRPVYPGLGLRDRLPTLRRIPHPRRPHPVPSASMRSPARLAALVCSLVGLSGCLAPWNIRLPMVYNDPPATERIEQQYHDPYPDSALGPSTGSRPRWYDEQRPLPVRIREKSDVSRIINPAGNAVPPPISPAPGSQYPAVVPF